MARTLQHCHEAAGHGAAVDSARLKPNASAECVHIQTSRLCGNPCKRIERLRQVSLSVLLLAYSSDIVRADDNGRALTPPMGWRSWNQYQGFIKQELVERTGRLLVARTRRIRGRFASLADVGYTSVGIDDGWQACGHHGPQGYRYHNADGSPVVDTVKFPDLRQMVELIHRLNLTAGWYGNACGGVGGACSDHCATIECFAGDVNATLAYGFNSIKLDGCGAQNDILLWHALLNHSARVRSLSPVMIENCHNGLSSDHRDSGKIPHYDEHGSLWCPFHTYRTSGDARPTYGSVLTNLNTTIAFARANLSVPGCWAYPDMLEVGVTNVQHPPGHGMNCGRGGEETCPPLSVIEARTHFGAWAIVSSPLVLGNDLNATALVDAHWETITNEAAIEVNQDYAGFSGTRFAQSHDLVEFQACGWGRSSGRSNATCAWPRTMSWYKPLSGRDSRGSIMAILLMNNGEWPTTLSFTWGSVPGLGTQTGCRIYDVWLQEDLGHYNGSGYKTVGPVLSRDSVFLTLSQCF